MISNEVFHYTVYIKNILTEREIRISQFGRTNDPKESRNWIPPLGFLGIPPKDINLKLISDKISEVKLREWKVLSMSKHHARLRGDVAIEEVENRDPFLLGYCRPNLWAHYASCFDRDSYSSRQIGACIKFNKANLHQQIQSELKGMYIRRGSVRYSDQKLCDPPRLVINYNEFLKDQNHEVRNHLCKYYKEYLLVKSRDWQTEYEFRWIVHSEKDRPEKVSIRQGLSVLSTNHCEKVSTNDCENALSTNRAHE